MGHSIENTPFLKRFSMVCKTMEGVARYSGLPRGPSFATVTDVDDPQERGRVRVLFDAVNQNDIPQTDEGGPREGSGRQESHWINTCPAFKGKHPPGLIGKRVTVNLPHSQYQYAVLNDVVYDPEDLTEEAANRLEIPNNSTMVRLPIYPSGGLPPPCTENAGCIVIETGGPQGDDWLTVCLKRGGSYMWVRHIDRLHYHTGQLQDNDTEGNGPDSEARTYDSVIQTTGNPQEGSN